MIFALYHAPHETSGLIGEIVKELGLSMTEVHLYDGEGLPRETSDLEGLVVMGGPMSVNDVTEYPFLLPEMQLIERVIADEKPVLGICLGAQLMARALGKKVYRNRVKEVGWYPIRRTPAAAHDPLFSQLPEETTVLHWHGETFDLPDGAHLLAHSERCEHQAFRIGHHAYGLQFHFEVTEPMLKTWCSLPEGKADLASSGQTPEATLSRAASVFRRLDPMARDLFRAYFKTAYARLLPVA